MISEDSEVRCINCGIVRLYKIATQENESLRNFNTLLQQGRKRLIEQRKELIEENQKLLRALKKLQKNKINNSTFYSTFYTFYTFYAFYVHSTQKCGMLLFDVNRPSLSTTIVKIARN